MIITASAYDQLTEAERTKFDTILQGHTKYQTWSEAYPAAEITARRSAF